MTLCSVTQMFLTCIEYIAIICMYIVYQNLCLCHFIRIFYPEIKSFVSLFVHVYSTDDFCLILLTGQGKYDTDVQVSGRAI